MGQDVQEISSNSVKENLDEGMVLLIDVREPMEYAIDHIPGALLMSLSTFDPAGVPDPKGRKVVFHCQSGVRSFRAAKRWSEYQRGQQIAYNMAGGMGAWKALGFATRVDSLVIDSVHRQIYMWVGLLLLLSSVLALWVSEWFLLIPALCGVILIGVYMMGVRDVALFLARLK